MSWIRAFGYRLLGDSVLAVVYDSAHLSGPHVRQRTSPARWYREPAHGSQLIHLLQTQLEAIAWCHLAQSFVWF